MNCSYCGAGVYSNDEHECHAMRAQRTQADFAIEDIAMAGHAAAQAMLPLGTKKHAWENEAPERKKPWKDFARVVYTMARNLALSEGHRR